MLQVLYGLLFGGGMALIALGYDQPQGMEKFFCLAGTMSIVVGATVFVCDQVLPENNSLAIEAALAREGTTDQG